MGVLKRILPQGELTPDKAWWLGFAAGDGCLNGGGGRIRGGEIRMICGPDRQLADLCEHLAGSIYGVTSRLTPPKRDNCWIVACSSKLLVEDMKSYGAFGVRRWSLPAAVRTGAAALKGAWVAGLTDADGYVQSSPGRYVEIGSINEAGLRSVGAMLLGMGIETRHYVQPPRKPHHGNPNVLRVRHRLDVEAFSEAVPLRCERKADCLAIGLVSYVRKPTIRKSHSNALEPDIRELVADGRTTDEIAREVGLPYYKVDWIRRTRGIKKPGPTREEQEAYYDTLVPAVRERIKTEGWGQIADYYGARLSTLRAAMVKRGVVGPLRRESEREAALRACQPLLRRLRDEGWPLAKILTHSEIATLGFTYDGLKVYLQRHEIWGNK